MSKIANYIKRLAESEDVGIESFLGTVTAVDEAARTCTVQPLLDDAEFLDVWLQGNNETTEGMVIIPKLDSNVICIAIDDFQAAVISTTEVEKILIDTPLVEFNGGSNGGLINIADLKNEIDKINSTLNGLQTIFNAWTPLVEAPLSTAVKAWIVQNADLSNITDDKIKH